MPAAGSEENDDSLLQRRSALSTCPSSYKLLLIVGAVALVGSLAFLVVMKSTGVAPDGIVSPPRSRVSMRIRDNGGRQRPNEGAFKRHRTSVPEGNRHGGEGTSGLVEEDVSLPFKEARKTKAVEKWKATRKGRKKKDGEATNGKKKKEKKLEREKGTVERKEEGQLAEWELEASPSTPTSPSSAPPMPSMDDRFRFPEHVQARLDELRRKMPFDVPAKLGLSPAQKSSIDEARVQLERLRGERERTLEESLKKLDTHEPLTATPPPLPMSEEKVPTFSTSTPSSRTSPGSVSSVEEPKANTSPKTSSEESRKNEGTGETESPEMRRPRVLWFTMDTTTGFIEHAKRGGPSGEIVVRRSLERAFDALHVEYVQARNDAEFARHTAESSSFDFFILDRWTIVDQSYRMRRFLDGRESDVYLLDFFGAASLNVLQLKSQPLRPLNLTQFLTSAPTQWNTFLGYAVDDVTLVEDKKPRGVVLGKDRNYFQGKVPLLRRIAEEVELHTVLSSGPIVDHPNVINHGLMSGDEWRSLLASSHFVLGLGHPLMGPSIMESVAAGCVFINPMYDTPLLGMYHSQHQPLAELVGEPRVCSVRLKDENSVLRCVRSALQSTLDPHTPVPWRWEAYLARVRQIFRWHLSTSRRRVVHE